jgi:hypothetical protein
LNPLFFIFLICIRQLDFQMLENIFQASDFDTELDVSTIFGEKGVSMSRTSCGAWVDGGVGPLKPRSLPLPAKPVLGASREKAF